MITVVHVRKAKFIQYSPGNLYIGRNYAEYCDEGWGNHYHVGPDGDRIQVLAKYKDWLIGQDDIANRLLKLKQQIGVDGVLGCWCKPSSCHGDILAEILNKPVPVCPCCNSLFPFNYGEGCTDGWHQL